MKITVDIDGTPRAARLPFNEADHVIVSGVACPHCKRDPVIAGGSGITHHDHDTYHAQARCLSCGGKLGEMRTKVSTIFGIDEDEAVLNGRARVY